jgi:hypothetical protein
MSMKRLMTLCIIFFSLVGSWIGAAFDHGSWFGLASTITGIVGCFVGIWAAYLLDQYING